MEAVMRHFLLVIAFVSALTVSLEGQVLKGSKAVMKKQFNHAKGLGLSRAQTEKELRKLVEEGALVEVSGNRNYSLFEVSFRYTLPEVKLFIERLSEQSRSACKDGLEVSDLSRPLDRQPWNASPLSVHPAGMAVDFRIPRIKGTRKVNTRCNAWLRRTLVSIENGSGVIDATQEHNVPHYHVAVFPDKYEAYVKRKTAPKKKH
ncbi:MAG: DUF5715 family protein [Candidatus Zambryskibacteria bacterium]|nr:DUF5715 family protein [Candidatus Zambryskibacteria bacterium]